jgi:uncharacterized membrane protein
MHAGRKCAANVGQHPQQPPATRPGDRTVSLEESPPAETLASAGALTKALAAPEAGAAAQVATTIPAQRSCPQTGRSVRTGLLARMARKLRSPLADPVLAAIVVTLFALYTVLSVVRYLTLTTTSWDLGIFTEYVKQYAHLHAPIVDIRGPGFNLLGDHFHPIVALIAPFFLLFPTAITLLVAQALLAAVSVIPVYRAGADLLSRGAGLAIAAAYGFSWGLQQLVNYDFHEIAFAVPLLAFSLSALVRGRTRAAILWALPLVLVKEDQGFTLAAIGIIIALHYRRRAPGLFLAGWGLAWSLLAILVIIPHFNPDHVYAYWFDGGTVRHGVHLSIRALAGQLGTAASTKLTTLALVLLATGFIALRSPLVLAIVPNIALRFVSTNFQFWGTTYHYNAPLMPIVFIAAIDAMARVRAARLQGRPPGRLALAAERHGVAVMVTACAALAFQFSLSALWNPSTYVMSREVQAEDAAMAQVPDGVTVATNSAMLAPLATRTDTFWLGNYAANPVTQYIVVDARSSDFVPGSADPAAFVESVFKSSRYQIIFVDDDVFVLRRASEPRGH